MAVAGEESDGLANERITDGQRIAGFVLLAGATISVLSQLYAPSLLGDGIGNPVFWLVSGGIDLIIGICLIFRIPSVLIWAQIRLVLGSIHFSIIQLSTGQTVDLIITLAFGFGLTLLLFGDAKKVRTIVAMSILVPIILLPALGIAIIGTGV